MDKLKKAGGRFYWTVAKSLPLVLFALPAVAYTPVPDSLSVPVLPENLYSGADDSAVEGMVTLFLEGTVGFQYRGNIFSAPAGATTGDLVLTMAPRAKIKINTGDVRGDVTLGMDYDKYLQNSDNDQLDLFLRANTRFQVSDTLAISAKAAIERDQSSISYNADPAMMAIEPKTALNLNGEVGVEYDNGSTKVSGKVGLDLRNYGGIQATADPINNINTDLQDRTRIYANVEVGRAMSRQSDVIGGVDLQITSYPNQDPLQPSRNSTQFEPYAGIKYTSRSGEFEAEARLGLAFRLFSAAEFETKFTPTLHASIAWTPNRGNFSLFAETDTSLKETQSAGVGAVVAQTFEVGAKFRPSDRFELGVGVTGSYEVAKKSDFFGGESDSNFSLGASVDARYYFYDNFFVETSAFIEQNFASASAGDYMDYGIGLQVGMQY
ncbi:MAG TPA: outer membrane beta-barrel protein [Paracoccaceae bacterium]|nr:outer membrane beta-barrel protein [Paracoccaceae bacterium]